MEIIKANSSYLHQSMTAQPFINKYSCAEKTIEKIEHLNLRDIIYDLSGGATPTAKGESYLEEHDKRAIPFLRIQNVGENELIKENMNFINPETHYNYLKRSILKEKDVLVTITGRVGTACVIEDNFKGNINQHIARISILKSFNPYFVSLFINTELGKLLTNQFVTGGTRIALDYDTLLNVKIPLIQKHAQDIIVDFYKSIKKGLSKIQEECSKIKKDIEPFLLNKLGLTRINKNVNQYNFSASDIIYRFDYLNVNAKKKTYLNFLGKTIRLADVIYSCKKGNSPKPEEIQEEVENIKEFYPMMRIQDISKENKIQSSIGVYVRKYIKGFNYTFLEKEDLIFVITGATIGKIAFVEELKDNILLGNDMIAVRFIEDTYNPAFIYHLFNTVFYQEEIKTSITGQTNGHLDPEDIFAILVPDITVTEQNHIVKEISEKFLNKIETKEKLIAQIKEKSKELIEKLILEKADIKVAEIDINKIYKLF